MGMTCNIDRKGRIIRGVMGGLLVVLSLTLAAVVHWAGATPWIYLLCGFGLCSGVFAMFESYHGWCVMRHFGFKTPF